MTGTQAAHAGGAANSRRGASQRISTTAAFSSSSTMRPAIAHPTAVDAAAKQRTQHRLRAKWRAAAAAPQLRGRRAAAWLSVWDSACAAQRVCMLEALKALHSASNSNALEEDLGDAAPLLLTRITSWWKLRYGAWVSDGVSSAAAASMKAAGAATVSATLKISAKRGAASVPPPSTTAPDSSTNASANGSSLAVTSTPAAPSSELLAQVEAITIFLRGSRFLLQFVEGGGAATLTHCLETTASSPPPLSTSLTASGAAAAAAATSPALALLVQERRAITLLLLHVVNAGRVYREMVGDKEGLLHVLRALQRETDALVVAPLTELLAVLGQGHPRLASGIQTGLLRVLADAVKPAQELTATDATSLVGSRRVSEVAVLHTARAIRALQLQREQHHYAQFCLGDGAEAALEAGVDYVPIVGMDRAENTWGFAGMPAGEPPRGSSACDPLLRPLSRCEYLDTLFQLALADQDMALQVEGCELLSLAAKNLRFTQDILTRCLDAVDDDEYVIHGDQEDANVQQERLRRQRRQLSCGRTAALLLISRPMTSQRRQLLLRLVSQRSGHLTFLKHLRLTAHGDTATLVDCCHALQFIVRAAAEMQRQHMDFSCVSRLQAASGASGDCTSSGALWLRVTEAVQAALGESMFQLLLFQKLSESDCMAVLRAARAAVVPLGGAEAC
ncbi:conserved hypothetical protein [Leishmania infantum JPCM5]|uniref:Uncharacterized protein n=2 Tax=Leishmania infantum TaxID=5671 RepID=A4I196_LEIIN|nr:conserved hypothetical protein [Leishmania infantum JPCM5]CAC9493609.1 hypothetical_protein_-_conserved [Leishmania infantum]CAM68524.1 conserved hypothetical protein [Leishmania infantum JPCM5]SUZ42378.1 hypothetical_protein_-_conserved [Leishmania infantum]|eukprot:XP_001466087.1 conserved hypothetical protein [Leishmania infantum JPCM5]